MTKAVRDSSADVRWLYMTARKAGGFIRDRPRRAILRNLPRSSHDIDREAGFRILPAGTLAGVDAVLEQARAALASYDRSRPPAGKSKKRFLVNVLHAQTLTLDAPILQFALRPDVLGIVSRYLGLAPLLTSLAVFHSDATDDVPVSSQLYHCDGDDVMQVKVFIYCNDVDPASGPLTVLDAAATAAVLKRTGYKFGARLSDDQVRSLAPAGAEHPIVGPAGTVALVDTSRCLHYGSRVAPGAPPRLAVMIQYSTPYSFMLPVHYRGAVPYRHLIDSSLSPLQRLVLGA